MHSFMRILLSSRDCDHKKPGKALTHTKESLETTQIQVLEEAQHLMHAWSQTRKSQSMTPWVTPYLFSHSGIEYVRFHRYGVGVHPPTIFIQAAFTPLPWRLEHAAQRRTKSQRKLIGPLWDWEGFFPRSAAPYTIRGAREPSKISFFFSFV